MFKKFAAGLVVVTSAFFVGYLGADLAVKFYERSPVPTVKEVMPAASGKYPALVRLFSQDGGRCSGVVISDKLVLTAAHCLDGKPLIIESVGQALRIAGRPMMANPRADYGLVFGDFTAFSKLETQRDPSKDILYFPSNFVMCGFPYGGATPVCYPVTGDLTKYVDKIRTEGQLYPGMSGGPVIDLNTGNVVAVNSAVMPGGVLIAPLVGLFVVLGE